MAGEPQLSNMILVVDDDSNVVDLVRLCLKRDGYEVLQANNRVVGLGLVREELPDRIVLDLLMPLMDGTHIRLVVNNLLENAIIHTPAGGSITVSNSFSGTTGSEMVRVTVVDSEAGIQSEGLAGVFDRFFRVDHLRARATGEVGLRLTIAKQFVEVHGGTIHVERVVPTEARFVFELPVAPPYDPT